MRAVVLGAVTLSFAAASPALADGRTDSGRTLFAICSGCHDARGQGIRSLGAPRIAGQAAWYGLRQLRAFASGRRGGAGMSKESRRMAKIAAGLSDAEMAAVADHVAGLSAPLPKMTVVGDAAAGAEAYAACAGCHGEDGGGDADYAAPSLIVTDDWYFIDQMRAFRDGTRGGAGDDAAVQDMRMIAETIEGEAALADLAAHINALAGAATSKEAQP